MNYGRTLTLGKGEEAASETESSLLKGNFYNYLRTISPLLSKPMLQAHILSILIPVG